MFMSRTIYVDEDVWQCIEEARNTDKGKVPKNQAVRNLLGLGVKVK